MVTDSAPRDTLRGMQHLDSMGSTVLTHLRRFDQGIAPTLNEIVSALLEDHPQWSPAEVRRCVSSLDKSGEVRSRWDKDAYVYWAPTA